MTSLKNHIRLKCYGKQHQCDVCEKFFNNYLVLVVHKRVHVGERPYKCVDCGERFNCVSSLKTHYKLHKQQNLNSYNAKDFAHSLTSSQKYVENQEPNCNKWTGLGRYTGKFYINF